MTLIIIIITVHINIILLLGGCLLVRITCSSLVWFVKFGKVWSGFVKFGRACLTPFDLALSSQTSHDLV